LSGQLPGCLPSPCPGEGNEQDWLRAGIEVDHRFSKGKTLSASLFAAGQGEDPDISRAISLKWAF